MASQNHAPGGIYRCRLGQVELAFAQAGPADGELVILLHGFPEYAGAWLRQMAALSQAGFHAVAPDQRGYGRSSKPPAIADYDLDKLADDVIGLASHLGHRIFSLVGHDWGALVAWWVATREPSALRRVVAINAPHPSVWREGMAHNWRQWIRSSYVRMMRIPRLPEFLCGRDDYKAFRQALAPAKLSPAELDRYRDAWSQPGAVTGMINWYRAFQQKRLPPAAGITVDVPTLIIWGDRDRYLMTHLADTSARMCRDARVVHIPECTHWVQHEQPDRVSRLIVEFLSEPRRPPPVA